MNPSATDGSVLTIVGWIFLLCLALLWLAVPFVIFAIKSKASEAVRVMELVAMRLGVRGGPPAQHGPPAADQA